MIISIFAASAILAVAASAHHRPNVTYIGNSSIEGLTQYLGIPYARPPVGYLRFAPPKHLPSHPRKTVNATAYGPGCPQLSDYALYNGISEDCLTLNIVVPTGRNASSPPLPVMFWVHGGGNVNGQSIFYNGTELVKQSVECGKPVIYVGINYRLGGFGFLTNPMFNDAGLSNLGLMDQHLALDWVHKHIAGLGGDPKKVTIFGESAGAANCWAQAHYASTHNETGKYFRAIITQSGAPGSPAFPTTLLPEEGVAGFEDLLESANCTGSNDTIACLRTAPYDAIAPVLTNLSSTSYTLDGAWFKDDLATLLRSGSFAHLPTIHGANLDEGSAFMPDVFDFPNTTELTSLIASYTDNNTAAAQNIISAYPNTSLAELGKGFNADTSAPDAFYIAEAVYSDLYMHLGRRAWLKEASKYQPTWGYVFAQQPPLSTLNLSYEYPGYEVDYYKRLGVYHGSELSYVFGEVSSVEGTTKGDTRLAVSVMRWWINFAWEMDPNYDTSGVAWPVYNASETGTVMYFEEQGNMTTRVGSDTMRQRVYDAWNAALVAIGQSEIY